MRHVVMLRSADASAPAVPTGLTATGAVPTVTLTWDASADPYTPPTGASGLKEYVVSRNGAFLATVASTPGLSLELTGTVVGALSPLGSDSQGGASHAITAGGNATIYDAADRFRYKAAQVTGDCTIIAKVVQFNDTLAEFAKAGLMFRASLDANAAYVNCMSFSLAFSQGCKMEYRASTGANAQDVAANAPLTASPRWLKLVRSGNNFAGYYSTNGNAWVSLGVATVTLPATCYVGLAVASEQSVPAIFDDVTVQNIGTVTYVDTTASGTPTYTVAARDVAGNTSSPGASATLVTGFSPNYPRIGTYFVSPGDWGNSANWPRLALACNVVFTHFNQAQGQAGRTLRSAIDGIKALVPAGMGANPMHTAYVINDEVPLPGDSATQRLRDWLDANNGYMYVSGGSGTIVPSSFPNRLLVNRTTAGPVVSGKNWIQWKADLDYVQNVVGESGNSPNPSLDGDFFDNCYWKPRVDADWNRDGVTDSNTSAAFATAERTGIKAHFDYARAIWPTARARLGNITDTPECDNAALYNNTYTPNFGLIAPLYQVIDGGVAGEYWLSGAGEPFSKEYQERNNGLIGFWAARNQMRFCDEFVTNAALNIYSARDVTGDNQTLRFAVAFCCVCSDGDVDDRRLLTWSTMPLVYTGGTGIGWLGQATQARQYTPYSSGVYVRSFQWGYVAVNPRNNGAQSFTLTENVRDVVTNALYNAGSLIPIADRDGVFLRKV